MCCLKEIDVNCDGIIMSETQLEKCKTQLVVSEPSSTVKSNVHELSSFDTPDVNSDSIEVGSKIKSICDEIQSTRGYLGTSHIYGGEAANEEDFPHYVIIAYDFKFLYSMDN